MKKQYWMVLALLAGLSVSVQAKVVLLPRGEKTVWRYLDAGRAPDASWRGSAFDDSGWKRGKGPLGYGEEGLGTALSFGDDRENKHMTAYFRSTFRLDEGTAEKFGALEILLRRDDGAVVYLNGREAARSNMQPGRIEFRTPASIAVGPANEGDYHRFIVPVDLLSEKGLNTVAVEVHQANPGSSDLFMDLEVIGLLPGEAPKRDFFSDGIAALRRGNFEEGATLLAQLSPDHPEYARTMAVLALQVYGQALGRPKDGLEFARKAYEAASTDRQVVRAYIKAHVLSGVLFDDDAIKRKRKRKVAQEHRFLVTRPGLGDSPLIGRAELEADLDYLEHVLVNCFAYLELKPVDYRRALDAIRLSLDEETPVKRFNLQVAKLISLFCDGHAGIMLAPAKYLSPGYAPFLAGSHGDRVFLYSPKGGSFLDPEHPYVVSIDGQPIARWMEAASYTVVKEPAHRRLRESLENLRFINYLRSELGLTARDTIRLALESGDGEKKRTLKVDVTSRLPEARQFPHGVKSRWIGDIGYLRIPAMTAEPRFLGHLRDWMIAFRDSDGLVIDLRGNYGGSKDILLALLPYFLKPGDPMRVVEFSTYRKPMELPGPHPEGYMMSSMSAQPVTSSHWKTAGQRAQVGKAIKAFKPKWKLPMEKFSEWHVLAFDSTINPRAYYYDKPLVILQDSGTFSAGDIFVGAFKGLPNTTLMGMPSGGGNGWKEHYQLPNTKLGLVLCQSAKFRPTGEPYDGLGVPPDVLMEALPEDILGKSDTVLDAAVKRLEGK